MGVAFKKRPNKPLNALGIIERQILDQKKRVAGLLFREKQLNRILAQTSEEMKLLDDMTTSYLELKNDIEKMCPVKPFDYNNRPDIGKIDFNIPNAEEIARRTRAALKQSDNPNFQALYSEITSRSSKNKN